jgi:hypothetical protein
MKLAILPEGVVQVVTPSLGRVGFHARFFFQRNKRQYNVSGREDILSRTLGAREVCRDSASAGFCGDARPLFREIESVSRLIVHDPNHYRNRIFAIMPLSSWLSRWQ